MRTLSQDLLDAQAELNRQPESEIIIRDVMLRLTNLVTTDVSIVSVLPPSVISDIPYCPIDGECYNGSVWRAWMNDQMYCQEVTDPTDPNDWATAPVERAFASDWPDLAHRPSTESYYLFWGSNGDIKTATPCTSDNVVNFRSAAYTVDTDHIALAAVSSTVVYMVCLHTNTDFQYLSLHRVTGGGVVDCPHTVIVDSDYNVASLTWFDAATLQGRDIIVLNERSHGHPVAIIYEDSVWSDPQPLLPQDIVDNYSFVRVAGLKVEDGQLLATGRIGRAGSTGLHPQACDALFRSKDGDHWTFDRYCYLCEPGQKSSLLITGGRVYYPGRGEIKHANQPYLIGSDPAELKWTINDDLLSWDYEQPAPGVACAGNLSLADHDGDHSVYLKPGFWLWRYAGYNSFSVLLSTEAIDTLVGMGYTAGDRSLSLATRDIAMRLMKDWASSQDWQWLSQQKHYDDVDIMDHLYAIAAAKITVRSEGDHDETGEVDQGGLEEEDGGGLEFKVYNNLGIFLTTVPFDARNYHVKARFQFQNDSATDDPGGLAMDLTLAAPRDPHIGHGFGVVGCAVDKYNFIAAFAGLKDNKLYLVAREGDEDANTWTKLAEDDFAGGTLVKGEMYEVELTRAGRHLKAQIVHFDSSGVPTRTELAEISHDWNETDTMVSVLEDIDIEDDRAKVGVIANIQVPETWLERVRFSANMMCRQAGLWDATGDRQGPAVEGDSAEDDFAEWDESGDIVISGERIAISQLTQGNKKSKYYLVNDVDAGTKVIRGNSSGSDFNWADDGAGGTWGLAIVNGPGRGFCYRVTAFNWKGGPGGEDEFTVGDAGAGDLSEISAGSSYFHVLPGFYSGRANTPDAESYGLGVRARQHEEDRVVTRGVWAYDDERDKTLEWVMKDISAKAGILVWDLKKVTDVTVTPPAAVQPSWLDDAQRDFDLTITLPAAAGAGDSFVLIARATSKLAATPVDGNLTDFAAVKLTYSYDGADWTVSLHQTSDSADAVNRDDWVLIDGFSVGSGAGGKRLRFVGHGNFFSIYVNDYRLRTFHTGHIYGYDTDGYSASLEVAGYIGIWCTGATADWTDTEITQPELWTWTDAVILDQRMNAVAGLERAIRDRRVRFFGTPTGALRISTFDSRDELPTIGDLLYSDGSSPTDRIPTHIRVVGAEISEHIDHVAAAEYGLLFALAQAESLEEEEAYIEAQRLIDDAVSQSGARGQTAAAQLDWEVEDKVPVSYVPVDGSPTVNDDYIVDGVQLSFRPGDMTMQATVRKAP